MRAAMQRSHRRHARMPKHAQGPAAKARRAWPSTRRKPCSSLGLACTCPVMSPSQQASRSRLRRPGDKNGTAGCAVFFCGRQAGSQSASQLAMRAMRVAARMFRFAPEVAESCIAKRRSVQKGGNAGCPLRNTPCPVPSCVLHAACFSRRIPVLPPAVVAVAERLRGRAGHSPRPSPPLGTATHAAGTRFSESRLASACSARRGSAGG